jgi:hypothetical protein
MPAPDGKLAAWLSRRFAAQIALPPSRLAYSLLSDMPPSPTVARMEGNVAQHHISRCDGTGLADIEQCAAIGLTFRLLLQIR